MEETFNELSPIEKKSTTNIFNQILEKISGSKTLDTDIQDLIKNLKNAQSEFENAISNYEFADDPELIDYYTYKIKATQTRYQYLLRKVKEKGL